MELKSLVEWGKYVIVAAPLIGASATVIIYAEELKNSIGDIRKEQAEIRQTQNMIRAAQTGIGDKITAGHDRIIDRATRGIPALSHDIGRLTGILEERARREHSRGRTEHER